MHATLLFLSCFLNTVSVAQQIPNKQVRCSVLAGKSGVKSRAFSRLVAISNNYRHGTNHGSKSTTRTHTVALWLWVFQQGPLSKLTSAEFLQCGDSITRFRIEIIGCWQSGMCNEIDSSPATSPDYLICPQCSGKNWISILSTPVTSPDCLIEVPSGSPE